MSKSKYYNTTYFTANNSTDAYHMGWDIEKYRDIHECEEHWQLRKAFMEKWKNNFPEERLVCLARVYTNIEFMGCRYPAPVMQQIAELSFEGGQKYKDKKKTKLQRTFVSASTAAENRARGIKRIGGEIVTDDKPKSSRIAFVAQGETPAPVKVDSDEEGLILLNRGAFSTFIAPDDPIANALSSSVDTGMILAKIVAETKTQSNITSISQGVSGGQASSALASTSAEEVRYSKSKWKRIKSKRNKQKLERSMCSDVTPQPPSATTATAPEAGGGEARPRAPNVKRQSTDPSEGPAQRPKAKRPNLGQSRTEFLRSSAREQNELAVTVHREDGVKLDDAAATLIKQKLADLIEAAAYGGVSGRCLSFATSGLVSEGFFLVTPMTVEARDWLLGCDFGTYNDVPIRCTTLNRCRVAIWIPTTRKMPEDPLILIKGQNDYRTELKISEWTLLHREMQPLGMRLVLGVPQDVIGDEPGYVWLNFQATQVQARLL